MRSHTIRPSFAALLLFATLLLSTGAAAQTALIDTPLFQLNDDGSLVSLGAFGTGVIPASGAGVRLMWHPAKAAFRAGVVNGTQWDEANIGIYSVAMGSRTTASGEFSVALGRSTTASGNDATALGASTTAGGVQSTAMGGGTMAMGNYATAAGRNTRAMGLFSVAMGDSTTASGAWSTALGANTAASGSRSTAMGESTTASGNFSVAMGGNTAASGNYATTMGFDTKASGTRSTAMGSGTEASGLHATAMGFNTTASGIASTAMGYDTKASGYASTAMGFNTTASGFDSMAMGRGTTASGHRSTAMGLGTTAQAYASLALGRYNVPSGFPTTWDLDDPVLVVGNGSFGSLSNALTLLKNGNLTIAGTLTENSDRRLKTDIRPLAEAASGLARLQPVRFRFREGTNRPEGAHIGLIAQEVQAVFPELVQQGADGYLSVSYTNLTAVLVQALNEQQAEIEALRTKNDTIQDRLVRLEAALRQGGVPASSSVDAQ